MKKVLLIQVTIYDEDTHLIDTQLIEHYSGSYGYEVENVFYKLGEKISQCIDPYYNVQHPKIEDDIV